MKNKVVVQMQNKTKKQMYEQLRRELLVLKGYQRIDYLSN